MAGRNARPKGHKYCGDHQNEELLFVCVDCKDKPLVCKIGISTTHRGHEFIAISLLVQEKYNALQDLSINVRDIKIPEVKRKVKAADDTVKEIKLGIQTQIQKVEAHGEYLKELISISTTETVSELNKLSLKITKEFKKFKSDSDDIIQKFENLMKESHEATKTDNNVLLLEVEKDISQRSSNIAEPEYTSQYKIPTFVSEYDVDSYIKAALGSLNYDEPINIAIPTSSKGTTVPARLNPVTPHSSDSSRTPVQKRNLLKQPIVSLLRTLDLHPHSIKRTQQGDVLIFVRFSPKLHILKANGSMETLRMDEDQIQEIDIHPQTGELYCVSVVNYSVTVRRVDLTTGQTSTVFTLKQAPNVNCFAVTHHSNILVGYRYTYEEFEVVLFSSTGTPIKILKMPFNPRYITVCQSTGRVAISHGIEGMTVTDDKLQHMYAYKPTNEEFCFYTIFDDEGHLLVRDFVQIVCLDSTSGEILNTLHTDHKYRDGGMCLDRNGDILVWGSAKQNKLFSIKYLD